MKFKITIDGDLREITKADVRRGKRTVTQAISGAGLAVKEGWRAQVGAAGLGSRLSKTVRHAVYPKGRESLNAATLVWSNAPLIMASNEAGAVIKSADGFWLTIPTAAAGKSMGGRRITPAEWERKNGRELQFVYRKGRNALLVDTGRAGRGNTMVKRGGKLVAPRTFKNRSVVIFTLVPQVKLPKRLSVLKLGENVAASLPGRITQLWRD